MMKSLRSFLKSNAGLAIAVALAMVLFAWTYGCESKVRSLTHDQLLVTRDELRFELDTLIRKAELKYEQLNQQDMIRQTIYNHLSLIAQTGTINPLGVVTALGTLLGIGATADNIRKRKIINANTKTNVGPNNT